MFISTSQSRSITRLLVFGLIVVILAACRAQPGGVVGSATPDSATSQNGEVSGTLVIYSGRSEPLIQPVLNAFQDLYPGIDIRLKSGSNSELANALLEERINPQADIFVSTELATIQALNAQGVFQSYRSQEADSLPPEFIGPEAAWTGVTRRARVIMYNSELVDAEAVPVSIFDLADPKWNGQVAAVGSTNGSMQAQIAAMRQLLGDEATEEWLRGLLANSVTFFGGHTDVRKAVGSGEFTIGLVNHYYYYLQKEEGSPVGIVFPDQGAGQIGLITNATAVGIVNGASNPQGAQALVDYLLSQDGQKLFAELNFEYPLAAGVPLHAEVEPLEGYRLADVDVAQAALNLDETFDLIEKVGMP